MIFIYDRDYNQVGVLDVDYTLTHAIGKVRKLNFESTVEIPKGHYIVIQKEGKYYEFVVVDADYSRSGTYIHRYHCQDTVTELQGYYIEEDRPKLNHREHIDNILKGTQWTLSTTTNYGETQLKQMYHFRKNVFETFKKIIDNYELEWYTQFGFSNNKITKREIVINKLGKKTNSRLEFEKNIVNFTRRILPEPVYTALVGLGKEIQEEGESKWKVETALRRLDFKDINNGLMYVENLEAKEKYGIGEKGKKQHFTGVVIFNDEEDAKVLLQKTKDELEILSKPRAEYEIDVANLNIDVTLGDEVPAIDNVIDFRNYLRVIKIEETARQKILTFGVITQSFSSVNAIRMEEMKESMNVTLVTVMESIMNELSQQYLNEDGYTYNLEISNEYGLPAGIYSFNKPIDQDPTKVVYMGAGKVLISNEKGTDGAWIWQTAVTGDGVVGSTLTTGSVTANKLAADVGQSLDLSSNTSISSKVGDIVSNYVEENKDQLKGDKGDKGDKGADGADGTPGKPGADGKDGVAGKDGVGITSTSIEYAVNQSGITKPTAGWSGTVPKTNPGDYIWTKTTWKYTDNTSEDSYSVGRIGANGADGNDGLPGAPGVGIKKTLIEYAKNTSGTDKPTTGWSTTIPSTVPGDFLWTRTTWIYTDTTSEQGYTVGKIGNTGATGPQGPQGPQGPKGAKGDTGEADYTKFREEYETELNVLQGLFEVVNDELKLKTDYNYLIENGFVVYSDTAPTDTSRMWVDSNTLPRQMKYFNEESKEWESIDNQLHQQMTNLEQTINQFEFQFTSVSDFQDLSSETNIRFSEINKYIRFIDGAIHISEEGNPFNLIITNDRISFMNNNQELAYFKGDELYVDKLRAITKITVASAEIRMITNKVAGIGIVQGGN